jgi:LPXTG-site transpeptidase (sortase) family protein
VKIRGVKRLHVIVSSKKRKPILRRWEKFFLAIGLSGSLVFGAWLLASDRLESYTSWRFDQALQGKRTSLIAYIDYLTFSVWKRIVLEPAVGSPRVPIIEIEKNPQGQLADAQDKTVTEEAYALPAAGSPIGRLNIPSIDLSVMVLNGTDEWVLNQAVGRIEGTALPGKSGNLGIAGHRDRHFRVLRKIREGDEITLTTTQGTFRYGVANTQIVNPADTRVLKPSSQPCLTLVTCYPFYYVGNAPKRFIVKAHLLPAAKAERARSGTGASERKNFPSSGSG